MEDKVKSVQRKYLLQEQLKVIRKELGMEKDDAESIVEKYTQRMEGMTIPSNIREVIDEELGNGEGQTLYWWLSSSAKKLGK